MICAKENGTARGLPNLRERVDPRTAGIAEAEQLGDFVEGLAGGVVDRAADQRVMPCAVRGAREIKVGVSAGDDQRQRRCIVQIRATPSSRLVLELAAARSCAAVLFAAASRSCSSTAWMWPSR